MMRQYLNYTVAVLFMVLSSCTKPPVYPVEPQIDFLSVTVADTADTSELHNPIVMYQLVFKVLDGDGDIGLRQQDTVAPFVDSMKNNLFITLLAANNGTFDTVDLPISLNYRIPYAETVSLNKYYKATVTVNIDFPKDIIEQSFDTIMFSFYLYDRAFHRSNTQQTPPLPVDFRGTYVDPDTLIY